MTKQCLLPRMRSVTVVGMGAIGGVFAAWLGSQIAPGQIQLSALARGATLRALQDSGLSWFDSEGAMHRVPLHATDDAGALGTQDLVIVSVKGPAMPQVAQQIRPLLGLDTVVLIAMNGVPWWFFDGFGGSCAGMQLHAVDPGGHTAAALPTAHVLGCVVHVSATAPQPGHVERIRNRQLIIGEPHGASAPGCRRWPHCWNRLVLPLRSRRAFSRRSGSSSGAT